MTISRFLAPTTALILASSGAIACSGFGPRGVPVVFGDQTNIIVWNARTHTEHFVRNALFRSDAPDFGFIVATPTRPDLSEASSGAYETLASLGPQVEFGGGGMGGGMGGGLGGGGGSFVRVLQEADVAGYHATTLASNDSSELSSWLTDHGYVTTPGTEAWIHHYISKRWPITAFKVTNKSKRASTGTIRMSFKTKVPFNPFYIPSDNIDPRQRGMLKVYFVASTEYDAAIGGDLPWGAPIWSAGLPYETANLLAKQLNLPRQALPVVCQVEAYEDTNFPRVANDEIYFTRRVGVTQREQPSRFPLGLLALFTPLIGLVAVRRVNSFEIFLSKGV